MPLSRERNRYFGPDNPFLDWWERGSTAWRAERVARWPQVSKGVRYHVSGASARMPGFRAYYVEGETSSAVTEGYTPPALRLALVPWRTAEEFRAAAEAYIQPEERHLRTLSAAVLGSSMVEVEGLPVERFDDEGCRRLEIAAEAVFPQAFTREDAECRDQGDPVYFQEHGVGSAAKPHPFLQSYQRGLTWFLARAVDRKGRPRIINPSDRVRDYYLSCLRHVEEEVGTFEVDESDRFGKSLRAMLTEILYFDELNPGLDQAATTAKLARAFKARLEDKNIPTIVQQACEDLLRSPPELVPHEPLPPPEPFAHLRFLRGSKVQYTTRSSPDPDTWLDAIAQFSTTRQRDRVMRLMGEPGRPASEEGLEAAEQQVFAALAALPTPYRVQGAGKKAAYFAWDDWQREHPTLDPYFEAFQALGPELAFLRSSQFHDEGAPEIYRLDAQGTRAVDSEDDPLFASLETLADG